MKKTHFNDLPLPELGGLSNMLREGGQIEENHYILLDELKKILSHLDCTNEFTKKGEITTQIRKKLWLFLYTLDQKEVDDSCDAYLDTQRNIIVFYPPEAEKRLKEAKWYQIAGILEDRSEVIKRETQYKEIEDELFPKEEDSPLPLPPAEEFPTKKVS